MNYNLDTNITTGPRGFTSPGWVRLSTMAVLVAQAICRFAYLDPDVKTITVDGYEVTRP